MLRRTPPTSTFAIWFSTSTISMILPGIARHIRLNPPRREPRVRHRRLTERYAAVVRRHAAVREDLEAAAPELPANAPRKEHVLKDAAGECDAVESPLVPDSERDPFDETRPRGMQ